MSFIKQCKGTDSDTVFNLDTWWDRGDTWFWSIKYDGQYAQIHIDKDFVMFYTSSGKPYYNSILATELLTLIPDKYYPLIIEAEYLGSGEGKLGGRSEAAVVTTLRTAFAKGITDMGFAHNLKIFDVITPARFGGRTEQLDVLRKCLKHSALIEVVDYNICESVEDAMYISANMCKQGFEGIYCKSIKHQQESGKRVKTAFKFKQKNSTIVTIVDIDEGTGKYQGMIGAFLCVDDNGMQVSVGSGLSDSIRGFDPSSVIGKRIRINYERIDNTYIFPIFIDFV